MTVRVKICGLTRLKDALLAVEYGADALGFNFWPGSKRYCPPSRAQRIIAQLPPFVGAVGIFVNAPRSHVRAVARSSGIGWVQLHGDESPEYCRALKLPFVKAIRVVGEESLAQMGEYKASAFLLDSPGPGYGGTGESFDWGVLRALRTCAPVILAGGLTPATVAEAVRRVRPTGVDVASGVESSPGRKDGGKMKRFIRGAKEAGR